MSSAQLLPPSRRSTLCTRSLIAVVLVVGLSACGADKKKESGQTLVKVNGDEITVLQLNDELSHTPPQTTQAAQEAANKQVLEALVDRQLLVHEAVANKVDRDPKVMQAIERAKAQILAQAYLQTRVGRADKPSKTEVDDYFQKHPEYFSQRKLFEMKQVVVANKDFTEPLRAFVDSAKSLDDVVAWLDTNKVPYAKGEASRSTADLPPPMVTKLQGMQKGQLFVVKEADRTLLVGLNDIKPMPVTQQQAEGQIEQYLKNQKAQSTAKDEITRLRSVAKLDYVNKSDPIKAAPAAVAGAPTVAPAAPPGAAPGAASVAGEPAAGATPADAAPAAAAAAASAAPATPAAATPNAGNVARGVAGLK